MYFFFFFLIFSLTSCKHTYIIQNYTGNERFVIRRPYAGNEICFFHAILHFSLLGYAGRFYFIVAKCYVGGDNDITLETGHLKSL
jgi:hypothetical protein